MNNTKRWAMAALGGLGAMSLVACSTGGSASNSESGGSDGATTSITFVGADPESAFAPLIEAFEAKHPDIDVAYENIPFDQYNNVIQQRVGAGDASIDVLLVDAGAAGSMASKGWLTDLSELAPEVEKTSVGDGVAANSWDDKMWALPMWTSAQYLYYNKALLQAAGVEAPPMQSDQRWTWEQTVEAAKKAQAAGAEWGLLFDQTDRYYQLQPLAESAGGGSGATGDDLLTADITNEGWIKAMTWYGSLFEEGVAPRGIATDQMAVLFASGKSAFFVGGAWSTTPISQADPMIDWGVAPNPMFEGGTPAMSTGSWAIGVSSSTDSSEAAVEFAKFASLDLEGNSAATAAILIPPTNEAAFDTYVTRLDESVTPNSEGMGALMLSELESAAVNRPNTIGFTQMQDVLGRAFADIRNGEPVDTTLSEAQAELQGLWDRL
ncbi:extracellular solute-binding protein [Actinomyces sp. B33]|uniref:ABC transporter substrate-binding protein n=1 Tax=Actinomyces sp. B33 TaxID=2942131 RepID=UPI0023415F12|nr:extracellular solute-binding protein [Actinomyces sp. B33]MDC4232244.1 extracellular solute-binding protein [Actinomyces sp. B33]